MLFPGRFFLSGLLASILVLSYGCSKLPVEYKVVKPVSGEVTIPVKEVDDGKVHFYTYKKSGKRINFFVRTDGTGKLSTYFDACFTCKKHKKGYRCEGTDLVCNECNMHFRLAEERWLSESGCSPISLTSRIDQTSVRIAADDLDKGERLF